MTIALRPLADGEMTTLLQEWWAHPGSSGLMCDELIRQFVKIEPMHVGPCPPGTISYGLGSYGYDLRVGYKFKVFTDIYTSIVDPKTMKGKEFVDFDLTPDGAHKIASRIDDEGVEWWFCPLCGRALSVGGDIIDPPCPKSKPDHIIIPPKSFALGEAVEHIEVPREVLVIGIGKSTYARAGVILNITPAEPEWRGKLTLEISNTTPLPVKIYANEGICQLVFFKAPIECLTSYADKKGRYQDQKGLTLPFVNK